MLITTVNALLADIGKCTIFCKVPQCTQTMGSAAKIITMQIKFTKKYFGNPNYGYVQDQPI